MTKDEYDFDMIKIKKYIFTTILRTVQFTILTEAAIDTIFENLVRADTG